MNLLPKKSNTPHLFILISACLFVVAFHMFAYIGHYGFDDIYYARLSKQLVDGAFHLDGDHFKYRWVILFFTALFYKLFGVNDTASSLPAIILSMGIIYMIYYVLKNKQPFFLLAALVFYCFNLWTLSYSDKLMADIYVAFFAFLSIVIYYRFRYVKEGSSPSWNAIVFSLALFLGFISKETIIMLAPLFLFIFVSDIIRKQHIRFWIFQIASLCVLLFIYGVTIKMLTGSAMSRFEAIELNSYINPCSYDLLPVKYLLKRISYEFVFYFTQTSMITGLIFVIPLLFNKKKYELIKIDNADSFFLVSSLLLFLACNFMTISYKSYVPLCLDPRHYLFLIPVLSIAASGGLFQLIYEKKNWPFFVAVSLLISAIAYFNHFDSAFQKYIPILVIIVGWKFIPNKKKWLVNTYTFLMCCIIGAEAFVLFRHLGENDYTRQRKIVYEQIINRGEKALVITNKVQKYFGEYYSEFDTSRIKFITYEAAPHQIPDSTLAVYILNNYYTNFLSKSNDIELPLFANGNHRNYQTLINSNGIELYKLRKPSDLLIEKSIYKSFNDFEREKEFWTQNAQLLDKTVFYEGKTAFRLQPNEYSATFRIKLNQLPNYNAASDLFVKTSVQVNLIEDAEPQLVISLDKDGKTISWDGLNIKDKLQVLNTWQKVNLQKIIPAKIDTGAVLSIYVWNNSPKTLVIDAFEVNVLQENTINLK